MTLNVAVIVYAVQRLISWLLNYAEGIYHEIRWGNNYVP
jgi:hypothetical protein